jgi:6,7-dimethyl-8-ribityllumazine synthase
MAGPGDRLGLPAGLGTLRVLLVVAPYHREVTDLLCRGALALLGRAAARTARIEVPGALEIPTAIALAARTGGFDAFVALGCVIRGQTSHYELVAGESCRGLVELGIRERLAIGNGILTVDTREQALERADPAGQDKGGQAALAALALAALPLRLAELAV